MKTAFKSFSKLFVTLLSVITLVVSIQSCSNPFNPESKFIGKWEMIEIGGAPLNKGCSAYFEFTSNGVVEKTVTGRNSDSGCMETTHRRSDVHFDFERKRIVGGYCVNGYYIFEGNDILHIDDGGIGLTDFRLRRIK